VDEPRRRLSTYGTTTVVAAAAAAAAVVEVVVEHHSGWTKGTMARWLKKVITINIPLGRADTQGPTCCVSLLLQAGFFGCLVDVLRVCDFPQLLDSCFIFFKFCLVVNL
jgi:hypothetical protein